MKPRPIVGSRWLLEGALAAFVLAAGVLLYVKAPDLVRGWAFTIPGTTDVALEPSFFPRLSAVLLAASALMVIITIPMRSDVLPAVLTNSDAYVRVGIGLAGILIYLLAVVSLGFVVSTILFIIASTAAGGYRNWLALVPTAIAVAVGLRLLFRFGLHVSLPQGIGY